MREKAIVGLVRQRGIFEDFAGSSGGNGKIRWFVVGGRMMFLAFVHLTNSRCFMCPV
jgi:hypothetical protein